MKVVEQCLLENSDPYLCVGAAASACIESGGGITAVQGHCYDQELQYWNELQEKYFSALGAGLQRRDAEPASYESDAAEKLRDMQRTWIAYRDARCNLVDSIYGSTPAYVACEMRATAEQALVLRALIEAS